MNNIPNLLENQNVRYGLYAIGTLALGYLLKRIISWCTAGETKPKAKEIQQQPVKIEESTALQIREVVAKEKEVLTTVNDSNTNEDIVVKETETTFASNKWEEIAEKLLTAKSDNPASDIQSLLTYIISGSEHVQTIPAFIMLLQGIDISKEEASTWDSLTCKSNTIKIISPLGTSGGGALASIFKKHKDVIDQDSATKIFDNTNRIYCQLREHKKNDWALSLLRGMHLALKFYNSRKDGGLSHDNNLMSIFNINFLTNKLKALDIKAQ